MKKIGFFGHAGRIADLPIKVIVIFIYRLFALSALFSGIPLPEKEKSGFSGKKEPEVESFQDGNSVNEEASTSKNLFAATAKIRATDGDGNSFEVIY